MKEVGRPTDLTEELTLKIRKLVLDGQNYKNIQEILGINPSTWDAWVWKDYKDFRKALTSWEFEILIDTAKLNLKVLLGGEDDKIKADLTKFTLETLDKKNFSKRSETDITSGGKPIIQVAPEIAEKHNLLNEPNTSTI